MGTLSIIELEDKQALGDIQVLLALKNDVYFQKCFGISSIQRRLGFGYNRASRLAERMLDEGYLERPAENKWMLQFTTKEQEMPSEHDNNESVYETLQCLGDALAYCVYLLANNAEILTESLCSEPDEGNFDLVLTSKRNCTQNRDILIVQRDRLVGLINKCLQRIDGASIQLRADSETPSHILLLGDEIVPNFSVDFVKGHHFSDHQNDTSDSIFLFFPQSDFSDIPHMQVDEMSGEFWQINGNISLAKALWPFRIDYAAECIALSEYGNVIVCENREK